MLDHDLVFDNVFTHDATIEFHPSNRRQIVTLVGIEQAVEENLNRFFSGRLTRTHHAVDGNTRSLLGDGVIGTQGLRDEAATVEVTDVQRLQ